MAANFGKKGAQAPMLGNVTVLLIMVFIIGSILYYVMVIPEAERQILLFQQKDLLDVNPGEISASKVGTELNYHNFPSITLDNTPQISTETLKQQATIEKKFGSKQFSTFTFNIEKQDLSSSWIQFYVTGKIGDGYFEVVLNDNKIFSANLASAQQAKILLPSEFLLEGANTIDLEVSSSGLAFWRANSYSLSDVSLAKARYTFEPFINSITINQAEIAELKEARVTALVKAEGARERLNIQLNGNEVFNSYPTSNLNVYIDPAYLITGTNEFAWEVPRDAKDTITFGRLEILAVADSEKAKFYDFKLTESNYQTSQSPTIKCELQIKKVSGGNEIKVSVNSVEKDYVFSNNEVTANICDNLQAGTNNIRVSAARDIEIEQLKITMSKIEQV